MNELATTLHPEGVHHCYGVLRQVMRTAVRHRMVATNPCSADAIVLPSKKAARANAAPQLYLTAQELRQLADAVPPHWRTPTIVAGLCGLRAGELWALRRCDIDSTYVPLRRLGTSALPLIDHCGTVRDHCTFMKLRPRLARRALGMARCEASAA